METTFKGKETRLGRKVFKQIYGRLRQRKYRSRSSSYRYLLWPLMNYKENGAKINRARGGAPLIYFMNIEPPLEL